jgi:hypothetical protein
VRSMLTLTASAIYPGRNRGAKRFSGAR